MDLRRRTRAGRPSQAGSWRNGALRLTVQPTARNKFNLFWDEQHPCQGAGVARVRPTAAGSRDDNEIICGAPGVVESVLQRDRRARESARISTGYGQRVQQATWTSPMTNRLLLEAGVGTYLSRWGGIDAARQQLHRDLVRVTEQCTGAAARNNGGIANLRTARGT